MMLRYKVWERGDTSVHCTHVSTLVVDHVRASARYADNETEEIDYRVHALTRLVAPDRSSHSRRACHRRHVDHMAGHRCGRLVSSPAPKED